MLSHSHFQLSSIPPFPSFGHCPHDDLHSHHHSHHHSHRHHHSHHHHHTLHSHHHHQVNQRPALAQFLCLKNIRLFLASCTKYRSFTPHISSSSFPSISKYQHFFRHHHPLIFKYDATSGTMTCGRRICSSHPCFTTIQTLHK